MTAKVKGYVELPKNETEMAMWLTKNGPISIGINANAMQVKLPLRRSTLFDIN